MLAEWLRMIPGRLVEVDEDKVELLAVVGLLKSLPDCGVEGALMDPGKAKNVSFTYRSPLSFS